MTPPVRTVSPSLALKVFAPFALGYFVSYLFRTVNAVVGPVLADELALSASDLGLLTSAYFLTFAAMQLPLGIMLDRQGPRRTEAWLLVFAAGGAALFATGDGLGALIAGRALVGIGVSACLMAAFKAFVVWFPPHRLPLANGLITACGGLGAMAATAPVELALQVVDWRTVFWALAAGTVVVVAVVWLVVPEAEEPESHITLRDQIAGMTGVLTDRLFWRMAPAAFLSQAAFNGVQGLWAGPWLRDVAGLQPDEVARVLFIMAGGMIAGYALFGLMADKLARHGIKPVSVYIVGNGAFLVVVALIALGWTGSPALLWAGFGMLGPAGILMYAVFSQHYPVRLAGRVNASLNLMVFVFAFVVQWGLGGAIDLFGGTGEGGVGFATQGYETAFWALFGIQAIALAWMLSGRPWAVFPVKAPS